MTEYEHLLSDAIAGLLDTDGPEAAIVTAASLFETIHASAETYADTDPSLFATWMMTAAEAADGRDALAHAASARPGALTPPARLMAGELERLAQALTGLLTAVSGCADDPAEVAACDRAAACAERIHDLLAQDTS